MITYRHSKRARLFLGVSVVLALVLGARIGECTITWQSYDLSSTTADFSTSTDKQTIVVTINVYSSSPITFVTSSFDRADGQNIFGGGSGLNGQSAGNQQITITLVITAWGGDGQYVLSGIVLENQEEEQYSYAGTIEVTVTGTRTPTTPQIQSVTHEAQIDAPSSLAITVVVTSNAQPYMLCMSITRPDGSNREGGCGSQSSTLTATDTWSVTTQRSFSRCEQAGSYDFVISVTNEGLLQSTDYSFSVQVATPQCDVQGNFCTIKEVFSSLPENYMSQNGDFYISAIVDSSSLPTFVTSSMYSPTGKNIYGGGGGIGEQELQIVQKQYAGDDAPRDYYQFDFYTYTITDWSPRGKYSYRSIYFTNEQNLNSAQWQKFEVTVDYPDPPLIIFELEVPQTLVSDDTWKDQISAYVTEEALTANDNLETSNCLEDPLGGNGDELRRRSLQQPSSQTSTVPVKFFLGALQEATYERLAAGDASFLSSNPDLVASFTIVQTLKDTRYVPVQESNTDEANTTANAASAKLAAAAKLMIAIILIVVMV